MATDIVYKLFVQLRNEMSLDIYNKCLTRLTELDDFSLAGKDDNKNITEYRASKGGRNKCALQVSPIGFGMETSTRGNVEPSEWDRWIKEFLNIISSATNLQTKDLSALALVYKYRIPRKESHYDFLGNELILDSPLHKLIEGMQLYDIDYTIKTFDKTNKEMRFCINITSNQDFEQIADGEFDEFEDKLIFEFHSVRIDPKSEQGLIEALDEQKQKLQSWLESGKLTLINKAVENE